MMRWRWRRKALKANVGSARVIDHTVQWLLDGMGPDVVLDATRMRDLHRDLDRVQLMARHIAAVCEGRVPPEVVPDYLKPKQE